MKKVIFVLLLIFIIRVMVSCCRCSDETEPMELNQITVVNLNTVNSMGETANYVTDTMPSSKLAFQINVTDSTLHPDIFYYGCNKVDFGFNTASATSCDCYQLFEPEQQIVDVRIFSLHNLTEQIKANTDVTEYFVALLPLSDLYTPIADIYPSINRNVVGSNLSISMNLFCKLNIQNSKAQFVINVELSDGRMLSAFTNEIKLISGTNID